MNRWTGNKPPLGTELDRSHPLCPASRVREGTSDAREPKGLVALFNEGAGSNIYDLLTRGKGPYVASGGSTASKTGQVIGTTTGGGWSVRPAPSRWGGPTRSHTATTDIVTFSDNQRFLALDAATIVIAARKRDSTVRTACLFGIQTLTASQYCIGTAPNSGGNIVWAWGGTTSGTNLLSVSGVTFGDDVYVFSVGPRGMDVWQNGRLMGSQTGHSTRTGNVNEFRLGNVPNIGDTSDLIDYSFLYIYDWQLSYDEIRSISAAPFQFFKRQAVIIPGPVVTAQSLGGTLTSSGALKFSVSRVLGGTLTDAGALTRQAGKPLAGALTTTGSDTNSRPRTRLYFPASTSAAAAPSFDGGWSDTSLALRRRMAGAKGSSALADGTRLGFSGTAGTRALDRQYVSDPLNGAQNVGGTLKGQILVQEFNNNDNVDQIITVVKVVSGDGLTVRGTVLPIGSRGGTAEFRSTGYRNKMIFNSTAGSTVAAQNGDRIVVEIGYSNSTAGTTPEAQARWGENATDLAENETDTADGAGWIEFAGVLSFTSTSGSVSASGTLTPAGNLIKQPQKPLGGTLTAAGSDSNKQTLRRSYGGTLTTSGAAIVIQVFLAALAGTLTTTGSVTLAFIRGVLAAGILSTAGNLLRGPARTFSGILTSAGNLAKKVVSIAPSAELTTGGDLTPLHLFNVVASGALTLAGNLLKTPAKALGGTLTMAGALLNVLGKYFSGVLLFFGVAQTGVGTAPCGLTVADLRTRIWEQLDDDGTYYTAGEVLHALNFAQRLFILLTLCVERTVTFTITSGTPFYAISNQISDYFLPLRLTTSSGVRIRPDTIHNLDSGDATWRTRTGTPTRYAQHGYDLLAITPSTTGTINLTYAAMPTALVNDSDIPNDIPADKHTVLVDAAIAFLRLKDGGQELQLALQNNFSQFLDVAQRYSLFVRAKSKAQGYDKLPPPDLGLFDMGRLFPNLPPEAKKK